MNKIKYLILMLFGAIQGAEINNAEANRALLKACEEGILKNIKAALKMGADINVIGNEGRTPLNLAISKSEFVIVEELISQRADIEIGDSEGLKPLHTACYLKSYMITKLLIDSKVQIDSGSNSKNSALHWAIIGNNNLEQHLDFLLKAKANVNVVNNNCHTPLHLAAGRIDSEWVINKLIQFGAEVNARGDRGNTALHIAIESGNLYSLLGLLENNANYYLKNNEGLDALGLAKKLQIKDMEEAISDYIVLVKVMTGQLTHEMVSLNKPVCKSVCEIIAQYAYGISDER